MSHPNQKSQQKSATKKPAAALPHTIEFHHGLCFQYDSSDGTTEAALWWDLTQACITFEECIKDKTSVARALDGLEPVAQLILNYLIPANYLGCKMCTRAPCAQAGCPHSICIEHGWGDGWLDKSNGEYSYLPRRCLEPFCDQYFCWDHYSSLPSCDGCASRHYAHDPHGTKRFMSSECCKFCSAHSPTICMEFSKVDPDVFEYVDSEMCGMMVCSKCKSDHPCVGNMYDSGEHFFNPAGY